MILVMIGMNMTMIKTLKTMSYEKECFIINCSPVDRGYFLYRRNNCTE